MDQNNGEGERMMDWNWIKDNFETKTIDNKAYIQLDQETYDILRKSHIRTDKAQIRKNLCKLLGVNEDWWEND